MKNQLPKREELNIANTWHISNLFKSEELYLEEMKAVFTAISEFEANFNTPIKKSPTSRWWDELIYYIFTNHNK